MSRRARRPFSPARQLWPSWVSPRGRRLMSSQELVLSCFSPRSCGKNTQLHVSPGHSEQSDGAARHGPPAGVHRFWGVCLQPSPPTHTPATPPPRHSPTSGPPLGGGAGVYARSILATLVGGGEQKRSKQLPVGMLPIRVLSIPFWPLSFVHNERRRWLASGMCGRPSWDLG